MFTDSYYPAVDGAVVSLSITSKALREMGHEVVVFAPSSPDGRVNGIDDRVIWLPARRFGSYPDYRVPVYPSAIVSVVRKEAPDIIHSHGISFAGIQALIASRQTGIRNVLTYHTMVTEAAGYYYPPIMPLDVMIRLAWIYQRSFLHRPHAVIVPTRAIRDELVSHGIRAKRWEIIPTGVDCKRFSPENRDSKLFDRYQLNGKKVVLTVGRLAKEKNIDLIIRGFAELTKLRDDVSLVITGKGPAEQNLRSLVAKLGLEDKVRFTGFVPDSELPKFYASCDAFVIASRFETQCLVALEAMASGCRVAGINFRAIPEIIKDRVNGYLFDDTPLSLAKALDMAIDDRDKVSSAARKTAEEYCIEKCTARLVDLYSELSGKG